MRAPVCAHCGDTDRAQEIAIAQHALAEDDAPHAAYHAAGALALDPDDPDALRLVDTLVAWRSKPTPFGWLTRIVRRGEPPARAPAFPTEPWWGYHLVRVRAAWLEGARNEAFDLLVQVATLAGHVDLSGWWNLILDEAEASGERLAAVAYARAFSALTGRTVGLLRLRPAQQAFFGRWAALGLRLERHVEPQVLPMWAGACSGFLRRAGRFVEAAEVASRAMAVADPSTHPDLRVQWGLALRGLGRWDEAIAAFAGDAALHSNRTAEIARTQADAGRFDDAIATLEACEAQWTDEDVEIADFLGLLRARRTSAMPDDPHLRWMIGLFDGADPDYDSLRRIHLRETLTDVVAASMSLEVLLDLDRPADRPIRVDIQEAPSARMTLALAIVGSADPRKIDYAVERPVTPDPGEPYDPAVGVRLWLRDPDGALIQCVPQPQPATIATVMDLATRRLATDRAWRRAQFAAHNADGDDLVRALVWPPPAPAGTELSTPGWVFRWQRSVCLLLAAVDPEVSWAASRRRALLRSVVFSHPDWTTAAALLALLEAALDDPTAAAEARTWCAWLAKRVPAAGLCPWADAIERVATVLPGMPPEVLPAFREFLDNGT